MANDFPRILFEFGHRGFFEYVLGIAYAQVFCTSSAQYVNGVRFKALIVFGGCEPPESERFPVWCVEDRKGGSSSEEGTLAPEVWHSREELEELLALHRITLQGPFDLAEVLAQWPEESAGFDVSIPNAVPDNVLLTASAH